MQPFDYHYFIGYVSQVNPQYIKIHFPSSVLLSKFVFSGEEFNGGLVGTYITIEGENYGFIGQLQEIELSEKERLTLSDTAFKNQEFHPTAKAEILLSFDLFDMEKVTKGANVYPTIGAKVFVCTKDFVQKYIQGFGRKNKDELLINIGFLNSDRHTEITVSQQSFFGRHCAVVGTTGGGKSWSLSKLIEEAVKNNTKCILLDPTGEYSKLKGEHCILAENTYFSYKKLTISDLFLLLKPSEKVQAPKLLEAIKTLKTLQIAERTNMLQVIGGNSNEEGFFKKERKNKDSEKKQVKKSEIIYTPESIIDFMDFERIEDNMIIKNSGKKFIMAIECQGINYDLMSGLEKNSVEQGFLQFLNALKVLHDDGLLHRDISYNNVLVKQYDYNKVIIKISDFGLIKDQNFDLTSIQTSMKGTIIDDTLVSFNEYNLKNEIYSIGILLLYIFTGKQTLKDYGNNNKKLVNIIDKCIDRVHSKRYDAIDEIN